MRINKKDTLPMEQNGKPFSMYVFIYQTNHHRFCLGYYDFEAGLWMDADGMVIREDFVWVYLPIKQMKAFLKQFEEFDRY